MKKIIAAIVLVVLTGLGCASAPQNPQQTVYAAKQSYAVALTVAVAYKKLPVCGTTGATAVCSKPDVVATLQKIDNASGALLNAAENTVRVEGSGANVTTALKAATEAVAAFTTVTTALAVK
jgi:hypothetical protein